MGTTGTERYLGHFSSIEDVRDSFGIDEKDVQDSHVLYAVYDAGSYEGNAFVVLEINGKIFEVNGGHCSCHGLEGQWEPEETTWPALDKRELFEIDSGYREVFEKLVASRLGVAGA